MNRSKGELCALSHTSNHRVTQGKPQMIYEPIRHKRCLKCGQWFEATREFFHCNTGFKDLLNSRCKFCQQAATRQYAATRREEAKQRAKGWYWSNRERARQRDKVYRETHKDVIRYRRKTYAATHPETVRVGKRRYAERHRDRTRATN